MRGRREAGVGERHFHPRSLLASLAVAQGERETERNRERNCPEHISTDLHFICRFFPLFLFFHLLFLLYQQLHNCDVMTKASVIKSQTGQDEALLKTGRQKKEMKKRRDSERQTGRGLKWKRGCS